MSQSLPFLINMSCRMVKRRNENFLDVNERLRNRQLETDLYIKPTDTHRFLDTSCHPYHCKKTIPSDELKFIKTVFDWCKIPRSGSPYLPALFLLM